MFSAPFKTRIGKKDSDSMNKMAPHEQKIQNLCKSLWTLPFMPQYSTWRATSSPGARPSHPLQKKGANSKDKPGRDSPPSPGDSMVVVLLQQIKSQCWANLVHWDQTSQRKAQETQQQPVEHLQKLRVLKQNRFWLFEIKKEAT